MFIIMFDAVAVFATAVAVIFLASGWKRIEGRDIKIVLTGLLTFTLFYVLFLLIEWTGLSHGFEKFEDLNGALLPMWWAFLFYSFLQQADMHDLRKSEENLRITLNSIGDGMIAADSDGLITRMNPVAEKLTGLTEADALGKPMTDVFCIINSKSRLPADDPVAKVLQSGKMVGIANHTLLISHQGTEYQIADSAAPIRDDTGRISGVVLVFRDMTEEYHQAEALHQLRGYLANIIDSMPSVLIGVDGDGNVTQLNSEAKKIANVSPSEALGRSLEQVFPFLASELERVREAMTSHRVCADLRQPWEENGDVCYRDVTVYPLMGDGTEGAVIRLDDATEKVRFEEMLIQSEKMLSVGGLAAGMAHEINNPLAGMMQTAEVMSDRLTDHELPANQRVAEEVGISMEALCAYMETRGIPRMLKNIKQSGSRAKEIVQNMLSFARKSQGEFSTYHLPGLLDQTIELARTDYDLKKEYDFRRIKILREYEDDLPEVPLESGKIQQVLLNILRNGAEAMQDENKWKDGDAPSFTLRLINEKSTNMVRIEIQDNGPGMDEATRKRVFEPFFTTKPTDRGTGLGLSVSYFIITENHKGEMSVTSKPDEGTTFIIKLPAKRRMG